MPILIINSLGKYEFKNYIIDTEDGDFFQLENNKHINVTI